MDQELPGDEFPPNEAKDSMQPKIQINEIRQRKPVKEAWPKDELFNPFAEGEYHGPWHAIVRIEAAFAQSGSSAVKRKCGSGFITDMPVALSNGKKLLVVLTAAHVLCKDGGALADSIAIYASDGRTLVDTTLASSHCSFRVSKKYMSMFTKKPDDNELIPHDYGAVFIDIGPNCSFPNPIRVDMSRDAEFVKLQWPDLNETSKVHVAGYPKDKLECGYGQCAPRLTEDAPLTLVYSCDTVEGMSGAPVFLQVLFHGNKRWCAIGIHSQPTECSNEFGQLANSQSGAEGTLNRSSFYNAYFKRLIKEGSARHLCLNAGVALTQPVLDDITSWTSGL